jgi:hypothetical protein
MGQLVKVPPPTEEQKAKYKQRLREYRYKTMDPEIFYNYYQSGEDYAMWDKYYEEKSEQERQEALRERRKSDPYGLNEDYPFRE